MKKIFLASLIAVCLVLSGCSNINNTPKNEKMSQDKINEQNRKIVINEAIELIEKGQYDEASSKLVNSSYCMSYGQNCQGYSWVKWYGDCGTLNDYATVLKDGIALKDLNMNNGFYMRYSNPNYKGKFQDEILEIGLQIFGDVEAWQKAVDEEEERLTEIRNKDCSPPRVGMTKEQVLNGPWGKPSKINKTTTARGTKEQWVYRNNRYLYFDEDGFLTTIQE